MSEYKVLYFCGNSVLTHIVTGELINNEKKIVSSFFQKFRMTNSSFPPQNCLFLHCEIFKYVNYMKKYLVVIISNTVCSCKGSLNKALPN